MRPKARIFLDTSALFAGIWSAKGGARMLLRLGESGLVQLLVSPQVLEEIEEVVRRKASQHLPILALLLDRCGAIVVPAGSAETFANSRALVAHPGDARILADAWENGAEYLVTLDKAHFLGVPGLPQQCPFLIGTPGDCLTWIRGMLLHSYVD